MMSLYEDERLACIDFSVAETAWPEQHSLLTIA